MAKATPLVGAGARSRIFCRLAASRWCIRAMTRAFPDRRKGTGRHDVVAVLRVALHRYSADRGGADGVHFWRIRKDGGISGRSKRWCGSGQSFQWNKQRQAITFCSKLSRRWRISWPAKAEFCAHRGWTAVNAPVRRHVFKLVARLPNDPGRGIRRHLGHEGPNFYLIVGKPDNVPITAMLFISTLVLWLAMAQAVNNDRRVEQKLPPDEKESSSQKTWVWPDLLYIEFIALIICSFVLIFWAIYLRAPLEQPANPAATPNPSKAPCTSWDCKKCWCITIRGTPVSCCRPSSSSA